MGLFRFVFSKIFLFNVILAGAIGIGGAIGLFYWMDDYTEHDITVEVPDFKGRSIDEVMAYADTATIRIEVVDSVYVEDLPRGSVADQDPMAGVSVKRGRTVYLTVNALMPKQVALPDLRNLSLRQARTILETVGLMLGDLEYRPDIAKNAVLDLKVDGAITPKGTNVYQGTVVDLVLGDGLSNTKVPIPYLLYQNLKDATTRLQDASLNLGTFKVDTPLTDTARVRVYKQIPAFDERQSVPMGTSFILFLTEDTLGIEYDTTLYHAAFAQPDSLFSDTDTDDPTYDEAP